MPTDHIPVFEEQPGFKAQGLGVTRIPNELLSGVAGGARFNGAIIRWKGRNLMAYRRYNPNRKMRWIDKARGDTAPSQARDTAISVLDEHWKPTGEHFEVNFPLHHADMAGNSDECFEDARLFAFQGQLFMGIVYFVPVPGGCLCHQYLLRLDDQFQIEHVLKIPVGKNLGGAQDWEKNWTYFEHSSGLILLYNVHEMQCHEIHPKTGMVKQGWIDRRLIWPYGHMRGGTCPVQLPDGNWLKFVHSSTDGEWNNTGGTRRYSMSAVIFENKPPFKILKVSPAPIVWGSRHEAFCGHGNSQCVFPAGCIIEGDAWHVSGGVNDTFNVIWHLDSKKVMANMVDAEYFYTVRERYWHSKRPNAVQTIIGREHRFRITKSGGSGREGIIATSDPFTIAELLCSSTATEMTKEQYDTALSRVADPSAQPKPPMPTAPIPVPRVTAVSAASTLYEDIRKAVLAVHDGWCTPNKAQRMAGDVLATQADISVDLGAYSGRATIGLAFAHRKIDRGVCHAIDAWSNPVAAEHYTGTSKDWWSKLDFARIYANFQKLIADHHLEKYVKVLRMDASDAAGQFADESVSVLSFDADHSEVSSVRDISVWMPKIKPGGFIYFDDSDWRDDSGKCSTALAQEILLASAFVLTHTEPKNYATGEGNEWKIFRKTEKQIAGPTSQQLTAKHLFKHPEAIDVTTAADEAAAIDSMLPKAGRITQTEQHQFTSLLDLDWQRLTEKNPPPPERVAFGRWVTTSKWEVFFGRWMDFGNLQNQGLDPPISHWARLPEIQPPAK